MNLKLRYMTTSFDDHYLRVLSVGTGKWSSNVEGSYCAGWANSAPNVLHFGTLIIKSNERQNDLITIVCESMLI